jgi:hypothetical protein
MKKKQKFGFLPYMVSGFSFIPLCGVFFGAISILWGLITWKRSGKMLVLLGTAGIIFTVVIYGGLYYFGFVQRGGIYDSLRSRLAGTHLVTIVQAIEFYKLQNGAYPPTLGELVKSQPEGSPIFILDPTAEGPNVEPREFYYEVVKDGSGYYLLGSGNDGKPFTQDDLIPIINTKNTGLLINPSSRPTP